VESPDQNGSADYSTGVQATPGGAEVQQLAARIEALLFVAPTAVDLNRLASALEVTARQAEEALGWLERTYHRRGLALERSRHGYQLTSDPALAEDIERFLELESTSRLTKAALEVLAVVAYQQPVTRPHIDSIRGVNSDSALRTLVRYGLIEEVGRTDAPGRPILYATTPDFLQYFGLASLEVLPPLQLEPDRDADDESAVRPIAQDES